MACRRIGQLYAISVGLAAIDLVSKFLAETHLTWHESVPILGMLNFRLTYNTGIAFSLFSDGGAVGLWILLLVGSAISLWLVVWLWQMRNTTFGMLHVAIVLILGGALGNLIDRMLTGHVTDFIQFYHPSLFGSVCLPGFSQIAGHCYWPVFNLADVYVSVGFLLVLYSYCIAPSAWRRST